MVIEKILKQLTSERIKKELADIQEIKLPAELKRWIKEYEKAGDRKELLWKWMYKAVQIVTAPTISKKYESSLWEIKTLIIVFITLLDDIADKTKNSSFLNELLKIPFKQEKIDFRGLAIGEKKYITSAKKIWNYLMAEIKKYPRYKEFSEIFKYDFYQVINEMKYAQLINKNHNLINKTEYWQFFPYNMQGLVSYTVDLMCSLKFAEKDLGRIREIAWHLQKMSKIGNWISTWEREVKENDFTSGVIAYAADSNVIKIGGLSSLSSSEIIKKIKNHNIENQLLKEWEKSYCEIKKIGGKLKEANINKILEGAEKFLILHLIGRGHI